MMISIYRKIFLFIPLALLFFSLSGDVFAGQCTIEYTNVNTSGKDDSKSALTSAGVDNCCISTGYGVDCSVNTAEKYLIKKGNNSPYCASFNAIIGSAEIAQSKDLLYINCLDLTYSSQCRSGYCQPEGSTLCEKITGSDTCNASDTRNILCTGSCGSCKTGYVYCVNNYPIVPPKDNTTVCQAVDYGDTSGVQLLTDPNSCASLGLELKNPCTGECGCPEGKTLTGRLNTEMCVPYGERFIQILFDGFAILGGPLRNGRYDYSDSTGDASIKDIYLKADEADSLNWGNPALPLPIKELLAGAFLETCIQKSQCPDSGTNYECIGGYCMKISGDGNEGDACLSDSDCLWKLGCIESKCAFVEELVKVERGGAAGTIGGGNVVQSVVAGNYLYILTSSALNVYDVSNPAKSVKKDYSVSGLSNAKALAVSGEYAYAATDADVKLFDVSDLDAENKSSDSSISLSNINDIEIIGDTLFVSTTSKIYAKNISKAPDIKDAGEYSVGANRLYVNDGMVYALLSSKFEALSYNGAGFEQESEKTGLSGAVGIASDGAYVYVGGGNNFKIFDRSSSLGEITQNLVTVSGLIDIEAADNILVTLSAGKLQFWDITNPAQGIFLDSFAITNGTSLELAGNMVYVSTGSGVKVFKLPSINVPGARIGGLSTGDVSADNVNVGNDLTVRGARVCTEEGDNCPFLDGGGGAANIPGQPLDPIDDLITPLVIALNGAKDVFIAGDMAYAVGAGGLMVVNVENPSYPVKLGSLTTSFNSVYVAGKYAFVAKSDDGFNVIDVSDPLNIQNKKSVATGDCTSDGCSLNTSQDIWADGNYLYVTAGNKLNVFDITNPTLPVFKSALAVTGAKEIGVQGANLFLGTSSGIYAVDILNPANPVGIGVDSDVNFNVIDFFAADKYVYALSTATTNFTVADVSNVNNITAESFNLTNAKLVHQSGRYLYISNGANIIGYFMQKPHLENASDLISIDYTKALSNATSITIAKGYLFATNASGLSIFPLPKLDLAAAEIGSLTVDDLTVRNSASIGEDLNVGGNIFIDGVPVCLSDGSNCELGGEAGSAEVYVPPPVIVPEPHDQCANDTNCGINYTCDPIDYQCRPSNTGAGFLGASCVSSNDCQLTYFCIEVPELSGDWNNPGTFCMDMADPYNKFECISAGDCTTTGDICVNGFCHTDGKGNGEGCAFTYECDSGLVCSGSEANKQCTPYQVLEELVFLGITDAKYSENNFSNFNILPPSYSGVNKLCVDKFSDRDAHVCSTDEILALYNKGNSKIKKQGGAGIVTGGPPGFTANANDCAGFTLQSKFTSSGEPVFGRWWDFSKKMGWMFNCRAGKDFGFACCK